MIPEIMPSALSLKMNEILNVMQELKDSMDGICDACVRIACMLEDAPSDKPFIPPTNKQKHWFIDHGLDIMGLDCMEADTVINSYEGGEE
jgi:hypothetical protein